MAITIGTRLASYEITALLGKGGMGEVYRAHDTRLKRDVAIKTLPAELCREPERILRFQREAEVLAALNHPHIAGIYDLAEVHGERFLVMELVEGDTLEQCIARGHFGITESLAIAKQIAEALETAHEKGIIHRDLKPANIKITSNAVVKVLDFGLAKFQQEATNSTQLSNSPTLTSASVAGMILGTAAYMSPEQAKGKEADARSDVWSFGCVLYELLTSKPAFDGETLSEILGSVLKVEPDWNKLGAQTPTGVLRLLRRCLEKDPRKRLQHIGDARIELDDIVAHPDEGVKISPRSRPYTRAAWFAATSAIAAILSGGAVWWSIDRTASSEPRVFRIEVGERLNDPRISPDGKTVAFIKNGRLAIRLLNSLALREIEGTDGASNPVWSRDGLSLAYFTNAGLRTISMSGGASRVLGSGFAPFGATWCSNGIVVSRWNRGLWLMPDGGNEREFASIDLKKGETNLGFPHCLPDGRMLAVLRWNDLTTSGAESERHSIVLLDGTNRTELLSLQDDILWPTFTPPDSIHFQRRGPNAGLWQFTVSKDFTSIGSPNIVLENAVRPSSSDNGVLVVLSGLSESDRELVWVDRTGRILSNFGRPQRDFADPYVAPDGTRVVVGTNSGNRTAEIWIHHETVIHRPKNNTLMNQSPAWSPNGDWIAYSGVDADGARALFLVPTGGIGDVRLIAKNAITRNLVWTPDGNTLIGQSGSSIWVQSVDGRTPATRILENATEPAVSPDGRFIAYTSSVAGRNEIFLTTFPTAGRIWPVSADGGRYPRWNPRGGELFFASGPIVGSDPNSYRDLFVTRIQTKGEPVIGRPQRLFDAEALGLALSTRGYRGYEVSTDGQRILTQTTGLKGTPSITLIENWKEWAARQ